MKQLLIVLLALSTLVMGETTPTKKKSTSAKKTTTATTKKSTTPKKATAKTTRKGGGVETENSKKAPAKKSTKPVKKGVTAQKKAVKTTVTVAKAVFRKTATEKGAKLASLKKGDTLVVVNSVAKPFIKAKFKGQIGYVKINAIKRTATINNWVGTDKTISKKGTTAKKKTHAKSGASKVSKKDRCIGTFKSKKIYEGPKGGNYYLKNGKKSYLTKAQKKQVKRTK